MSLFLLLVMAWQGRDQGYIELSERLALKVFAASGITAKRPDNDAWYVVRTSVDNIPVVLVESPFVGAFTFTNNRPFPTSFSTNYISTTPNHVLSQEEAWEKALHYLRVFEFDQNIRLKGYTAYDDDPGTEPFFTIEADELHEGVPIHETPGRFYFEISLKTGQLLRFTNEPPVKPDPDTRCLVTPTQARSVMFQHLEGNWNQEVLEVVHRRAIYRGSGLGMETPELLRKMKDGQATLVWYGQFVKEGHGRFQFFVDAKTGELLEGTLFRFDGGFGGKAKTEAIGFQWDIPKSKIAIVGSKSEKVIPDASIERVTAKVGVKRVPVTLRIEKAVVRAEFDPRSGLLVDPVSKAIGRPSENLRSQLPAK